jgi:redox-sensitive bicupin YhaK (pirin superfamily)
VGDERVPIREGQLAVFGPGDHVTVSADDAQPAGTSTLEVLLLGGRPIREPIAHYGPFVMNTREEIVQAIDDYKAGRMGSIPPLHAPLR